MFYITVNSLIIKNSIYNISGTTIRSSLIVIPPTKYKSNCYNFSFNKNSILHSFSYNKSFINIFRVGYTRSKIVGRRASTPFFTIFTIQFNISVFPNYISNFLYSNSIFVISKSTPHLLFGVFFTLHL